MFKYLAGLFVKPNAVSIPLIKPYKAQDINKIRLYHGSIFDLDGEVEGIAFFMPENLAWEGLLNKSVLERAGPELDTHILNSVQSPRPGSVFVVPGFDTVFQNLFMGILNEWDGGIDFQDRDLVRCYKDSVIKAAEAGLTRIAFPAMGRDKRDFPHIRFARLAVKGIGQGLAVSPAIESVTIACSDMRMMETYRTRLRRRGWRE